jgi:hypothetical protein
MKESVTAPGNGRDTIGSAPAGEQPDEYLARAVPAALAAGMSWEQVATRLGVPPSPTSDGPPDRPGLAERNRGPRERPGAAHPRPPTGRSTKIGPHGHRALKARRRPMPRER